MPEENAEKKEDKAVAPTEKSDPSIFERFWALYPNHANKKTAEKKFKKLSNATIKKMVLDVKNRKVNHDQWIKGFIPHLATYINQERWNDPIVRPTGEKAENKNTPIIHPDIKRRLFREGNTMRYDATMEAPAEAKSIGEILKS